MKGLKPCPFCGGEAEISVNKLDQLQTVNITCSECSCEKTLLTHQCYEGNIIDDAFKAWNTRTPIDKVIEQLEAGMQMEAGMQKQCETVCSDDGYEQEIYDAYRQGIYDAFTEAIEIVKKGGAE